MILAPTLSASAGSGAAIARPTFSRDFAGEKTLNNGTGPAITFTRASNATFFDANGVLRLAPHNLLLHSEDFENAAWAKELGATVTANTSAAPDGSVTADTITFTTTNSNRVQQTAGTAVNGETLTFSVWLKGTGTVSILLDTSTGVGGSSEQVATLSSTWTRYTRTVTYSSPTGSRRAAVIWRTGNTATSVDVWGAQLVTGSQAGEYFRTTNAAASMPRFDHDPATGASRGLLIEEARTNLLVRSEEFGTTWSAVNSASVTSNTSVAPSGQTTADTLTAAANNSYIQQAVTFTGDGSKAISLFIKAGTSTATEVQIRDTTANASRGLAAITWTAGVPSATVTGGSLLGLTNIGSGWYRLQVEAGSVVAANTNNFRIAPDTSGGNGNILIWGAQAENGAFPTSYIPTTTAAATRSADSAVVTPISSFYNQSEGTLFAEFSRSAVSSGTTGNFSRVFGVDDGTTDNRVRLETGFSDPRVLRFVVSAPAQPGAQIDTGAISVANAVYRLGGAYALNDVSFYSNGSLVGTDSSVTMPAAVNRLVVAETAASNHIRKIAYYPRRLSNALLQQLTT